jgi:hypothetical protein
MRPDQTSTARLIVIVMQNAEFAIFFPRSKRETYNTRRAHRKMYVWTAQRWYGVRNDRQGQNPLC